MIVRTCWSCRLVWNIWTPWCGSVTSWKRLKPKFGGDISCAALANIAAMRTSCSRFFSASSLWNAMYLPSLLLSSSAIILKCLSEVSAITFKLFATSHKACLFDLTCCLFLWGATTIFCLFVSWLSPVSRIVVSSKSWMFYSPISTSFSWPPSLEISS